MFYLLIKLILASIVAGFMPFLFPQLALTQENTENQEDSRLSPPPDTGTPEDTSTPGGSRTDSDTIGACYDGEIPITSLIGNEIREFTVSKYPSFWFYVPCTNDKSDRLEFVLEDTQTKQIIYQTSIHLSEAAGIIEVALPNQSRYSLKQDKNYTWYLEGNYSSESGEESDIALSGWIRRIPLDSQLQRQLKTSDRQYDVYIQNEIMYNAITTLAKQYQTRSGNSRIKNDWIDLLKMLGVIQLANKPFVDSVFFEPKNQH